MSNKNMQKMKWVEMYNWVGKNTENQQKNLNVYRTQKL